METSQTPVLSVRDLVRHYTFRGGKLFSEPTVVRAVDGVSFDLNAGQTLGVVGESGSGKSTTARMVMRLVDPTSGQIFLNGNDITSASRSELRTARREMQMVFQDPYGSLNPRLTVAGNITEPLRIQHSPRSSRAGRVTELLDKVGLSRSFGVRMPGELSGGQRQRVCIARALAPDPTVVVLDEPVSSLDVSVQAQILNVLHHLQDDLGLSYLFISHDLTVVGHLCDWLAVMYLGQVVETGATSEVFARPLHPYTRALLSAVPEPDPATRNSRQRIILRGDPPSPSNPPSGCRFRTRCWKAQEICAEVAPVLGPQAGVADSAHQAACHFPESGGVGVLPMPVYVEEVGRRA